MCYRCLEWFTPWCHANKGAYNHKRNAGMGAGHIRPGLAETFRTLLMGSTKSSNQVDASVSAPRYFQRNRAALKLGSPYRSQNSLRFSLQGTLSEWFCNAFMPICRLQIHVTRSIHASHESALMEWV